MSKYEFKAGDRVIVNNTVNIGRYKPGDVLTLRGRFNAGWDFMENKRGSMCWLLESSFDLYVEPTVDDLIAQKTAAIAEAQSIIDAAKAEIGALTNPKVGDVFYRIGRGGASAKITSVLGDRVGYEAIGYEPYHRDGPYASTMTEFKQKYRRA